MKKAVYSVLFSLLISSVSAQGIDSLFSSLKYRNIGPFRGGRSVTASGVIGDPLTYYMGTTGGGLWKTEDAGQRWSNISDGFFKTGSVGAVAVSESDPNVVYCGMGEHAPRGVMTSYGDGVYKSTDAGKTWKKIGLDKTQHIARILIHPKNPDIVYVAAQGALYGPSKERGIYRSVDGGKSWKQLLFVNDLTGCSELSMDMSNPEVLYATMWHHQRKPWKVISGGVGSGVYKSNDGGDTWSKIENGLPKEKGKMAISVSRANPNKIYALIESDWEEEKGGLFVSNNAGGSWTKISGDHRLIQRAWYYIEVFTDPMDEHTVYVLSAPALRSIDGGKTWERLTGTHGDYHDLWINPTNSKNMVIANDGGAAITYNQGKTWSTQSNMPTAQFYRVSVDNLFPYNVYGGQQDNTSVKIASLSHGRRAITSQDWTYAAGGESAFLAYDPDDPKMVMGGSYLGTIELLDINAKASTRIMAAPIQYLGMEAREMKYLYNWNAPIIRSQHEEDTYYHGAQYLLRTKDQGVTWTEVSPDLTRNDDSKQGNGGGPYTNEAVGAENYGTLSYAIESPHEAGVIWTGSDDGFVQLTKDNGRTWTNATPKGLTECLVNAIDISPHDPAIAYIATTRYKFNDHTPSIYKTMDYGKSWTNISRGIPYGAYTRVVREDDVRKDLLYAGTETGIYVSWNGGTDWKRFNLNLPVVPITDLVVKNGNLVVATAGRSFWILDDLSLVRQFDGTNESFKVFKPADAILGNWSSPLSGSVAEFDGTNPLVGVNPANGVVVHYYLPEVEKSKKVTLEIKTAEGAIVRSFTSEKNKNYKKYDGGPPADGILSKEKGINRFVWNMRYPLMPGVTDAYIEGSYRGHKVVPGTYSVKLTYDGDESETQFQILNNPLLNVSSSQYLEYHTFMNDMEAEFRDMHNQVNTIHRMRSQLEEIIVRMEEKKGETSLITSAKQLVQKMKSWDEDMVQRKSRAYDDVENFPNKFTANFLMLINQTESTIPRVNQSSKDRYDELMGQWKQLKATGNLLIRSDVAAFNKQLWEAGIGAIRP